MRVIGNSYWGTSSTLEEKAEHGCARLEKINLVDLDPFAQKKCRSRFVP
jgi:hypothetical protein